MFCLSPVMGSLSFVLVLYFGLFPEVFPQQYQWKCSALDSQADRYYLPDLEEGTGFGAYTVRNTLEGSPPGVTYIYGVNSNELNCSGKATEVHYCYTTASFFDLGQEALVFTLSILDQDGATFTVIDTIDIRSTPSLRSGICSPLFPPYYCCDTTSLSVGDQFQIPPPNFAFGITISSSSNINLLGLRANEYPNFIVGHYRTSVSPTNGAVLGPGPSEFIPDQSFRAVRFEIRPQLMSVTLTPSINVVSSSRTIEDVTTSTPVALVTFLLTSTAIASVSTSASPSAIFESMHSTSTYVFLQPSIPSSSFNLLSSSRVSENVQLPTPSASTLDQVYTSTEEVFTSSINPISMSASFDILVLSETSEILLTTLIRQSSSFPTMSISMQSTSIQSLVLTSSTLTTSYTSIGNIESSIGVPDNTAASIVASTRTSVSMSPTMNIPLSKTASASTNEISSTTLLELSPMTSARSDTSSFSSDVLSTANTVDGTVYSSQIMSSQTYTSEGFIPSSAETYTTDFLKSAASPSMINSAFSTAITSTNADFTMSMSSLQSTGSIASLFITVEPSTTPMSSLQPTRPTSTLFIIVEPSSTPITGLDITAFIETGGTTAEVEATASSAISIPIIGGTVGGILALLLVLLIVVLVAMVIRRRLRFRGWKPNTNRDNGLPFHNALYDDRNLAMSDNYDTISRNLEHDYAGIGPQAYELEIDEKRTGASLPHPPKENSYEYVDHNFIGGSKEKFYESIGRESTSDQCSAVRQEEPLYMTPANDESELYSQLEDMSTNIVTRENVKIGSSLGSGQFGDVYRGMWQNFIGDIEVAIKTLKSDSTTEDKVKFLQEAAIMGQFKHPNVVTMHGVITDGEPILLVLEMLKKGDLRQYLLSMRHDEDPEILSPDLDEHILLSFCRQIASGMDYLSKKSFVHRDLAARNVLVSGDGMCKIADFGMSRDLIEENYYLSQGGGKIPVKWTAPEALHYKKYSTASDVWSYGVVMYEVWSVGHKPFEGIANNQVLRMVDSGFRLPPPPGCSRAIYKIMTACWSLKVKQRPQFSNICIELSYPDSKLLYWSEEDKAVNINATKLGAGLTVSADLYKDLQLTHMSERRIDSTYVDI